MALKLNLHHELDKQAALKRRDPLKFAMAGGIIVAVGFVVFYLAELDIELHRSKEVRLLEDEAKQADMEAQKAVTEAASFKQAIDTRDYLVKHLEGRFYWAPFLSKLQEVVPPEIQVSQVTGDVTGDLTKNCKILIGGLAAGVEPFRVADQFVTIVQKAFESVPEYRGVKAALRPGRDGVSEAPDIVTLDGKKLPTVNFRIDLTFETGEKPATPPPTKKRKDPAELRNITSQAQ